MIGVFDSGVGGLGVLREIRREMPGADISYLADQARAPYGTRELVEVREIALDNARRLIAGGCDCIVVACNTASAAGLVAIREAFPDTPIVGMEPAVKPASAISGSGKVVVYATAATFQGDLFARTVERFTTRTQVLERACPEWVTLVEGGNVSSLEAERSVRTRVEADIDDGADVAVLACTHFTFLAPLIQACGIEVVDPARAVARQVRRVAGEQIGSGGTRLETTGDEPAFSTVVARIAPFARRATGAPR